jgi:hypothetical protein
LPDNPIVASRDLQLHYDVAALLIDRQNVDEPPANWELDTGDTLFIVEAETRLD